jgi:tRNA(Arg) A34 adenosine deaminase TadA
MPYAQRLPDRVSLALPAWVLDAIDTTRAYPADADKVALAIALSRQNIEARSGGPFGAAVFGPDQRILAVGVNRVLPHTCSLAHAETMACMLAQQHTQRARLNLDADGLACGPITLATSAQPCCQCFGATVWAGIDRLLIGARSEDVEALTEFDEGPLPADWIGELNRRGIEVVRDLERDAACAVLRSYAALGGERY